MMVIRLMIRLVSVSKTSYTIKRGFNTGSKSKNIETIMIKSVKMMKTMRKCSEINRGAKIKVDGSVVIQSACFKYIVVNVTVVS